MRWSWPIARFAGIDVKVHATFVIILVLGAMQWSGFGVAGMAFGALLMLMLFVCVTLHEFGHSLVAQRFGIAVREIVLLPIGGVALLARNPSRPRDELLIAAAGPAVNVVIVAMLAIVLGMRVTAADMDPRMLLAAQGNPSLTTAMVWLLEANIALVVFNMIPAFPLDGGRMLRGLLGFFMEWVRATRVAALTGQVIAVGLGLFGVLAGNLMLTIIAMFIFLGAGTTYAQEQARTVLATLRVGDAYNKHALTLNVRDRISRVTDYLLTSYQPDFAVVRGRELVGVVSREQILRALSHGSEDVPVTEVMVREVPQLSVHTPLDAVQARMEEAQSRVAAVYDGGGFLGLVSAEDIAEVYMIMGSMQTNPNNAPQYATGLRIRSGDDSTASIGYGNKL
jgi:Zn-dependent protease/predicted transcriptional regulator